MLFSDGASLNDRLDALFEGVQNCQLFGKAQACALLPSGGLAGEDVRDIRIARRRIFHDSELNLPQRVFNSGLGAEIQPVGHKAIAIENLFQGDQIDRSLIQERLNARQIFEPPDL